MSQRLQWLDFLVVGLLVVGLLAEGRISSMLRPATTQEAESTPRPEKARGEDGTTGPVRAGVIKEGSPGRDTGPGHSETD